MKRRIRAKTIGLLFLSALFVINSNVRAQDPASSPSPSPSPEVVATKPATPPTAAAAPTPETDFWKREQMTGDWGGDRLRLKEEGLEIELSLTQFYQGVAAGGIRSGSEYNGIFKTNFKLDLGRMKPSLKWWSAQVQSETRFGGPLLGGTGTVNPVNTAALIPGANGSVASVTAVNLTRLIPIELAKGNLYAVSFGRFNLLDLVDEQFFGGSGLEKFFNIAQNGPLTALRQVPLITIGATFAYVRGGEPRFTLAVLDPNDHSTDPGLDDLFADGVTFAPTILFPTKYFGKTAKHSFGGAITTKAYTPFDAIRQIVIPGPSLNPIQPQRGSWSINYTFRQFIVERGPKNGWGFFSQVSFADKDTSPITTFVNLGLGGNGLFKSRPRDEFGVAYAYTDLSSVLKDNLNLLTQAGRRPRVEHQFEVFYNFHITPWLRLTGDLQVIRPTRAIATTAIIPGARLEMSF
jgi:porin